MSIGSHSVVEHHVVIGDGVRIHSGAFIPEFSVLEEGAWIGPHVAFTNALYPLAPTPRPTSAVRISMRGAKIGANATLLPGIVIGRDALVGAGSVVVRDVPGRFGRRRQPGAGDRLASPSFAAYRADLTRRSQSKEGPMT